MLGTVPSAGDTGMMRLSHCSHEAWGRWTTEQILKLQTMTSTMKKDKAGVGKWWTGSGRRKRVLLDEMFREDHSEVKTLDLTI